MFAYANLNHPLRLEVGHLTIYSKDLGIGVGQIRTIGWRRTHNQRFRTRRMTHRRPAARSWIVEAPDGAPLIQDLPGCGR
jgi:hypothetical protein